MKFENKIQIQSFSRRLSWRSRRQCLSSLEKTHDNMECNRNMLVTPSVVDVCGLTDDKKETIKFRK